MLAIIGISFLPPDFARLLVVDQKLLENLNHTKIIDRP